MSTISLEKMISIALLVPMGDPSQNDCIWGLPFLLWGSPGIGKTGRIRQAGKAAFLEVRTVYPATRAPEDFSGVPVVGPDGKLRVECILGAVRELCEIGRGVLFLEEISCAAPAVQAALLSVVLDRVVGDTRIPPQVRILSAANPPSEAAGGWELEPPMANRFAHYAVTEPSASEWVSWLLGDAENEVSEVEVIQEAVVANWTSAWARARGLMAGFFRELGAGKLSMLPKSGDKARGRAWPSPRTWEMAARAVATCYATNAPIQVQQEFVAACVGQGVAIEWAKWVAAADLPHPHDVVTKGWEPDKRRLDRTVAVLSSMAEYVLSEKDPERRNEYAVGAWNVLTKVKDAGLLDLAHPPAKRLSTGGQLNVTYGAPAVKAAARPVLEKLGMSGISELAKERR